MKAVVGGAAAGALVGAALFAADLADGRVGFMGLDDPRVIAEVVAHARVHAIEQQLLILATLVAICAALGSLGAMLGRRAIWGWVAALLGHLFFLLRSVCEHPQLYSGQLYDRGGARAAAMMWVTDHLSARGLDVTMAIALLIVVGVRSRRWAAGLVALAGALFLVQWARARPSAAPPSEKTNVLVIAVDSLRPDHVFGQERFSSLAELARRGVRYREAYVTQARTFPSFVSLLTGRWPIHHGIRHEFPPASARAAIGPSLPAVLQRAGFRTAVISDFSGEIFSRTPIGFDDVEVPRLDLFAVVSQQLLSAHLNALPYASMLPRLFPAMGVMAEYQDPSGLADRAVAKLDQLKSQPFFLTVFFSAPHTPYASPDPWYRKFSDPQYRGPFRYLKQPLPMVPALPESDARQVQALYDGAVGSVDAAIARVLRRLDDDGLRQRTIVVLLGDHGENLFDVAGRGMGHGDHLWGDLANHIPLVIVDPKTQPRDVDGIVREIDLAPTLAARLGVSLPRADGVDLMKSLDLDAYEESGLWLLQSGPGFSAGERLPYPDLWHSTEAGPDGDIFLQAKWEQPSTQAKVRAIRTARWKLIYQPTPAGVRWKLYDLASDPDQRMDVAESHPAELAELQKKLLLWIDQ